VRLIGLNKDASEELEAHSAIIFNTIRINLIDLTSRDMVEAMMEKLNEKKAPLDILEEDIASIEVDLGRNEGPIQPPLGLRPVRLEGTLSKFLIFIL
jgi:hypothetical protein